MLARLGGFARGALGLVVRLALVLIVLEGSASLIGFGLGLPEGLVPPEREQLHMRYDPELGWTHVPDTRLENFYGPGRHLTINKQGFRSRRAVAPEPPQGRLRAVCAGDAFTLGIGVDDADTWCAQLEALEPRLETVNMGQGGYGMDQAYLWYRRDGVALDTRLLLFALVSDDFGRMETDTYRSYGKPMLRLGPDGELEVRNVPVPNGERRLPWFVRNAPLFEQLRIVQLARPALRALGPEHRSHLTPAELTQLSLRVFEELETLARAQSARLVLVYLPKREEYEAASDLWRRRIAREARQRGMLFVDLVEEQRALSRREASDLYIPRGAFDYPGAEGHFNEQGNAWVARTLRDHLLRTPELAQVLEGPTSS